ncbi:homodimeric dihydroxyacetone kinase [Georgenia satyanarayanai]|uniref:Homodimeric dihydroxyacetone kinase n=1 Tax=Georgenia satyanarayanai TaxID=860221 RepID=A0A2Y9ALT4_9MICO|nr:dihydroxyacetone kinase family protein [Georgenia satyanarayanai]PYF98457.1 homodimeric dihydroxyacetone kinase [Georgenia satyanarayanai]SSA45135.1 homodimeric dihydroxyacetone kinase [Georgenia satyanarayanai]
MTILHDDPADFAEDALRGFVDAHAATVRRVPGGVVRRRPGPPGKVAVVVGGGSGHYPAFCGLVGEGLADGAVVGNVFTSPSAADAAEVGRQAHRGGGVLMLTGNYAGDVMNFTTACDQLRAEGVDARYLVVTDDLASAPAGEEDRRRGIAGDLVVFKVAAAAAERGEPLDAVEGFARHANERTRTLGVAFDGCTLPGQGSALFTVPEGRMGIGVGIHGEPGIGEVELPSAHGLARLLVERVLAEAPEHPTDRVAAVLNGLGRTKYEELFVVWATVATLLREAGLTVVEPEVGELVTSLDMAGCSLTLTWLDDGLEPLWSAPAAAPAYRKGALERSAGGEEDPGPEPTEPAAAAGHGTTRGEPRPRALQVLAALRAAAREVAAAEDELGRLDSVAGDGDHGRGMVRGLEAAQQAAAAAVESGVDAGELLVAAGRAWSSRAGGTSGILWGAMLEAAGRTLPEDDAAWDRWATDPVRGAARAVQAAIEAVRRVGRAGLGDKTMLDSLDPFHRALRADPSVDLVAAWPRAAEAARAAATATSELRPRTGRARPLADRSVGHADPGATSLALVVRAVVPARVRD